MTSPAMKCHCCGATSHRDDECAWKLKRDGRWNQIEWGALAELEGLERDALIYGLYMRDMPRAVAAFAKLGRVYSK